MFISSTDEESFLPIVMSALPMVTIIENLTFVSGISQLIRRLWPLHFESRGQA